MGAEPGGDLSGAARDGLRHGAGGQDDQTDPSRIDARVGDGLVSGLGGHRHHRLVRPGDAAASDTGALLDPLVVGVECRRQLVVGHDAHRTSLAEAEDSAVTHAGRAIHA